jgi:hypothetical protein
VYTQALSRTLPMKTHATMPGLVRLHHRAPVRECAGRALCASSEGPLHHAKRHLCAETVGGHTDGPSPIRIARSGCDRPGTTSWAMKRPGSAAAGSCLRISYSGGDRHCPPRHPASHGGCLSTPAASLLRPIHSSRNWQRDGPFAALTRYHCSRRARRRRDS